MRQFALVLVFLGISQLISQNSMGADLKKYKLVLVSDLDCKTAIGNIPEFNFVSDLNDHAWIYYQASFVLVKNSEASSRLWPRDQGDFHVLLATDSACIKQVLLKQVVFCASDIKADWEKSCEMSSIPDYVKIVDVFYCEPGQSTIQRKRIKQTCP